MNIAVDAMGGDHAPAAVVQGALQAAREWGLCLTLVGDRRVINEELADKPGSDRIKIHHCEEMVSMEDTPLRALRRKRDASIKVAFELAKKGVVDAVVSAGNSGATLAAAILTLGRVDGIDRPALPGIFPGRKGDVILIDVGANVDCRPTQLLQFGIMAHAFAISSMGMRDPKIGLMSIGEEGAKGNEQVRAAQDLFKASHLNFVGNVEGSDLFTGRVEIVVCDGFVGNVALKMSEGLAEALAALLKKEIESSWRGKMSLFLAKRTFQKLYDKLDYAEYGGAPILGIKGVGVVCHGGSSAKAIKNAIQTASEFAKDNFQECLSQQLEKYQMDMAS